VLDVFLGGRHQDAIRLGPKNAKIVTIPQPDGSNIQQRSMVHIPKKTRYRRAEENVKPILPPLDEATRATAHGIKTYLVNAYGESFTDSGFGNRMREWCDRAGSPQCTAPGLKKVAAMIVAQMGASDRQTMALLDWTREKQATIYTKKANRTTMAAAAGALLGSFSPEAFAKVSRPDFNLLISLNSGRSGGTRTPNPRFWRPVL
jgi:integrase